ncbi:efflux transporter outer membrane subunit [Bauldia sp.]|uniref:efflux transporter outer membrane subunit n=1 Tax=Bauldia sp. TaxID=2575872 RepID=UPI003BAD22EF
MAASGLKTAARRWIVPVLAGALMAGCAIVGPDFTTPAAPKQPHWVRAAVASHAQYAGVTERRQPSVEWWRRFNDPVLNQLVAMAYQQNLTLQIAGLRIIEARAQLGIVIGDQFPQTQKVGAEYKRERVSKNVGILRDIAEVIDFDPTFQTWSTGFDAGWELDIWGKVRRGIEAATANLVAQIADYDDVLVIITGDVATAYVTIRELQEELALARRNVNTQSESLRITELRFKNGVTTELDVDEAKALLNSTKAEIPALEADLVKAKNALAVLLGVPPGQIDGLVDRPGAIPRPPAEVGLGIPADLLRRRPDIRAAEMRAAAQSAQIGVAKADLYPQFGISGQIGFKATDLDDLFSNQSLTGLINPGISWDFLNYGRIRNNVRVQDARYQALIVNYQQTVLEAYSEVESALTAFLKAKQEALYLSRAVEASRKATRVAIEQYRDGTTDFTRVLNTQTTLLRTEQRLASVRADVVVNLIAVYKALGGGWQPANQRPFVNQANKDQMAARTNWGRLLDEDAITPSERALEPPPSPRLNPRRFEPADW